jgi:hypothetical protein
MIGTAIASGVRPLRLVVGLVLLVSCSMAGAAKWEPVPPVDLAQFSPDDFTDEELDMPAMAGPNQPLPYFLHHFHRLANAVIEEGPNRGFINIAVWRQERDHAPHNARIMENILSLAYFYCTDRPWNPYFGSEQVRHRLEAALDFWVRAQSADGRFSEYGPNRWNLAATAFATKFMGETLRLLHRGPPIDASTLERTRRAQRAAIAAVLTREDFFGHGSRFSNQYGNVWGGALTWLDLFDDEEIRTLLERRLEQAMSEFISPAGFFYELGGPDWGYAFGTHHSNLAIGWHYARGTDLARFFVHEEAVWSEWLAYNAVPEPDSRRFALNRSIETRQRRSHLEHLETPLAEAVPLMRLFAPTEGEVVERRSKIRRSVEAQWPTVDPLQVGSFEAYSPYAFLHRKHRQWHPTEQQRIEALDSHPVLKRERFNHQRMDDNAPLVYTFVRRPFYYATFFSGTEIANRQPRRGLGLFWHPQTGALVQSQSGSDTAAWATRIPGAERVVEADAFAAEYLIGPDSTRWQPSPGVDDLPDGDLTVSYPLSKDGWKRVTFGEDGLVVNVSQPGPFIEYLPLLLDASGKVEASIDQIEFERNGYRFRIEIRGAKGLTWEDPRIKIANRPLRVAVIESSDKLEYNLSVK